MLTLAPEPESAGNEGPLDDVLAVDDEDEAALGSRGASTMRVAFPVTELWVASKRSTMPGAESEEAVVRKPPWSTKAKPEGAPEAVSRTPEGTSEAFISALPTT